MKIYLLTYHPETTLTEVDEILSKKAKVVGNEVIEVEVEKEELVKLAYLGQSYRKLLVGLGKFKTVEDITFDDYLKDLLVKESIFKIDVEGVKGNENRIEISKQIAGKVFAIHPDLKIDVKKPEIMLVVYFDGKKYPGVALC